MVCPACGCDEGTAYFDVQIAADYTHARGVGALTTEYADIYEQVRTMKPKALICDNCSHEFQEANEDA